MPANRRILLIDDMPSIHGDFRKILAPGIPTATDTGAMEAALFGDAAPQHAAENFELDSAYQGSEGADKVARSLQSDRPYAMAFVDMRMPPGWDGVETIENIWRIDGRIQIVICTAFSDSSWEEVLSRLNVLDRLLVLKKPFDMIEVRQLANALTAKWDAARQAELKTDSLERAVLQRTHEILQANERLAAEINERKQLESQLIQSEKLASIGQLAAGIAHEINNPMGFIISNFSTLETYLDGLFKVLSAYEGLQDSAGSPEFSARLNALCEQVELAYVKEEIPALMKESNDGLIRVRKIVQDLRDFSRVDTLQAWEWADIHQGIDSTLNIISNEIKYAADVTKEFGCLPKIQCLPSQLNQVFMNLLLNAAHATGEKKGQITIRTGAQGEQVWIDVGDDGCGIAADVLPRIFDPFFTTKPVGKGSGLGLSVSYGIVKRHNGSIEVQTEVGRGTRFRVLLPITHTFGA